MSNINIEWVIKLKEIINKGEISQPRGILVKELLNSHIKVDMKYPILSIPERKLGYKFMARESWYILDGRNDVESITNYSKTIKIFSNNNIFFDGSYGVQILDQISYIIDILAKDQDTRQAVLTIWRPNPRDSKDIPCTISLQWLIRNNTIYCIDNMRSSDIWLGVPYDIHNMTMITGFVMLMLKERGINNLKLGKLYLNAGSQHLYENNFEVAEHLLDNYSEIEYQPFNPYEFNHPMELKHYLKALSEGNVNELNKFKSKYGRDILQI